MLILALHKPARHVRLGDHPASKSGFVQVVAFARGVWFSKSRRDAVAPRATAGAAGGGARRCQCKIQPAIRYYWTIFTTCTDFSAQMTFCILLSDAEGYMLHIIYRWTCHSLMRLLLKNGGFKWRCRRCASGKPSVQIFESDARICAGGGGVCTDFAQIQKGCTDAHTASKCLLSAVVTRGSAPNATWALAPMIVTRHWLFLAWRCCRAATGKQERRRQGAWPRRDFCEDQVPRFLRALLQKGSHCKY